ncbi:MAG: nucleotidyl transferase AbiEii/AbiGii toxin family protein [Pseudomonadota bacterium]
MNVVLPRQALVFRSKPKILPFSSPCHFVKKQNFHIKLEINTEDVVPSELKVLYSELAPASFHLQVMRVDYLVAQKIRALMQRGKGRDLLDLWFILKTGLPVKRGLVSELTGVKEGDLMGEIESRVSKLAEKDIAADMNPFIRPALRNWAKKDMKKDILQMLKAFDLLNQNA